MEVNFTVEEAINSGSDSSLTETSEKTVPMVVDSYRVPVIFDKSEQTEKVIPGAKEEGKSWYLKQDEICF